jgi:hypothetical protein
MSQDHPALACPNCGTPLMGHWCYACGQSSEDFHRSVWHLLGEVSEGLTHSDGRLWSTLRRLILKPGQLTRDYLAGRRAPQIPPFRLFLITVVTLLLAGSIGNLGPNRIDIKFASPRDAAAQGIHVKVAGAQSIARRIAPWVNARMDKASKDPSRALEAMESWAHQAALLSLLIAAPLLTLLFWFQKRFYFYDHLIFAMHSLSFTGMLFSFVLIAGGWIRVAWVLLVIAPVHLFAHMRGTYGTGVPGTLIRMAILFAGSLAGFGILFAALVLIGISAEG